MNLINKAVALALPAAPKPIVEYFSRRYIAGSRLFDAVEEVRRLNDENMCATIDVLGESITNIEQAKSPVEQYLQALEVIHREGLEANISVKPTQLGLMLDYDTCRENFTRLAEKAKSLGNFIRIDMEDATTTDNALRLYRELRMNFDNVGLALQACLRRTLNDLTEITGEFEKVNIRICKGIYIEPRMISWRDREIIRMNFELLLEEAFQRGAYIGIATHDEWLIWAALKIIHKMNLPRERYEFQMLLGVQPELRKIIVSQGHKLRVYVPFGEEWYSYSIRRLRENPEIAGHIIKALFSPAER